MSKALSHILTVFKVVRVIAKVVFILSIIGAVGCLISLLALPLVEGVLQALADGETAKLLSAYPACIAGLIACVGEAVFAFFAERYFVNVLNAGTPFTFEGAKESFRLGVMSIIISVAVSLTAGLVIAISWLVAPQAGEEVDVSMSVSLSTGLVFLFLSLLFKHGAELREFSPEASYQEPSTAEYEEQ